MKPYADLARATLAAVAASLAAAGLAHAQSLMDPLGASDAGNRLIGMARLPAAVIALFGFLLLCNGRSRSMTVLAVTTGAAGVAMAGPIGRLMGLG